MSTVTQNFIDEWVAPFYLKALRTDARDRDFIDATKAALNKITPETIELMLSVEDWRPRLTASWFCGLKGRDQFSPKIGLLLVEARLVLAARGYCFAMACFSDETSANFLSLYLERYMTVPESRDTEIALAALMWIDARRGTAFAVPFLKAGTSPRTQAAYEALDKIIRYSTDTFC